MIFAEYIEILEKLTKTKTDIERQLEKLKEPTTAGLDALVELLEMKKEQQKQLSEEHNQLEAKRDTPAFDEQRLSDVFVRYWAVSDDVEFIDKEIKKYTNQQEIKKAGYEITEELITEVKDSISIPMMCKQQGISMKRSGSDKVTILCPFHDEDSPSCMVYVEQDSWWCFGCGQGGDALKFYMLLTELDFVPAMHQLVERLGLVVQDVDEKKEAKRIELQGDLDYVDSEIVRLKQEYAR